MTEKQYKRFFKENQAELTHLGQILKEADSLTNPRYSEYSPESRRLAVLLVERWFKEAFATETSEPIQYANEGDNIFLRLQAEAKEGDL